MTEFSRLLRYLKPYRIIFAISVVLMVATGLFEGGMLLLLKPIFDIISGSHNEGGVFAGLPFGRYLPNTGDIDLRAVAILLVGLTLAKGVAEYFSSYFMSHIGQSVIADVRSSLYDHIMRQAAPFFSRHPTNELTAHLMSDAAMVERAVSDTVRDLLRESVSLVIYLSLLFNFNWWLASAMLLLVPPIAWLVTNFNRRLRHYVNSRQQSGAEMLDVAQES
ncbi:MAG TPA: ABC transporter transmembrane domain-containing protein, partial [Blastocatellia bacterium]